VLEVRWQGKGTEPAGEYTFLHGKWNDNHEWSRGFFVQKRIMSSVKRVHFVSDTMLYIIQRGCWFHIILLNIHAPRQNKTDDMNVGFYEELECIFDKFPKCHMKMLLDFNAK
jgi:hypothetical protein